MGRLAQRNGAVVSHVIFSQDGAHVSQRIPEGKADLILGLDYLETVRGLNFSTRGRTAVVCNKAQTPTIMMLIGEDTYPQHIEQRIRDYSNEEKYFGADFFELSEYYFGDRLYANLMMVGAAYQMGILPIRAETIEAVIRESVKKSQRENNFRAFRLGRRLITNPEMLHTGEKKASLAELLADKTALLKKRSTQLAEDYAAKMQTYRPQFAGLTERQFMDFARRYYDLILYENMQFAERFAARMDEVYRHEKAAHTGGNGAAGGFEATEAVIWNLHKVMAIKDEVWVAHLLTSEEKMRADRDRYNINPERGDRISYIHINRPHFDVLGMHFEWDMETKNWMLHLMKRMKFIRRLLPNWHKKEKAFRDWYSGDVIQHFLEGRFRSREDALMALRQPYQCTGYREFVYHKQDRARKLVRQLLDGTPAEGKNYVPIEEFQQG